MASPAKIVRSSDLTTPAQIAEATGLKIGTVRWRLSNGMTPEEIVATPLRSRKKRESFIGRRFSRLTVIQDAPSRFYGTQTRRPSRYLLCRCDCGKQVEVQTVSLKVGVTRSCGCLKAQNAGVMGKARAMKPYRTTLRSPRCI